MTKSQWNAFVNFRNTYKNLCSQWDVLYSKFLLPLQQAACSKDTPPYTIDNPVVYNTAFDAVTIDDDIKLIVVGDNPGKNEQMNINKKYLIGQSGKLAEGFFRKNTELNIDFRKNVIIMNKTPIHTAKTKHLLYLKNNGNTSIQDFILQSQKDCAKLTADLQKGLGCPLWLVGYTEMKTRGLFSLYRDTLKSCASWDSLFVFQHFSMNCFTKDLKAWQEKHGDQKLRDCLYNLGRSHRDDIFTN